MIQIRKAYTLIELLTVILIIGLLVTVVGLGYNKLSNDSKVTRMNSDLREIYTSIEQKRTETQNTLNQVTKSNNSEGQCISQGYTSIACKSSMDSAFKALGYNDLQLDPWGKVYSIKENERVDPNCLCKWDTVTSENHKTVSIPFFICKQHSQVTDPTNCAQNYYPL